MSRRRFKTPTILQMEATECGAASLAMVCAYWGKRVPLEQMRLETGVSRDGCSGADVMRAAKRLGLTCRAWRKTAESLWNAELPGPAMLFWGQNHFVVLEGIDRGFAWVNDPELGVRKLGYEEFAAGYAGVVLVFQPTKAFERTPGEPSLASRLRQRGEGVRDAVVLLAVAGLLLALPTVAIALLVGSFIDTFLAPEAVSGQEQLFVFVGMFAMAVAIRLAIGLCRVRVLAHMRYRVAKSSANDFLQHLLRLPLGFFEARFPGDVLGRIERNDRISALIADELADMTAVVPTIVFCLVALAVLNPLLAVLGLALAALGSLAIWFAARAVDGAEQGVRQEQDRFLGVACVGMDALDTLIMAGADEEYAVRVLELEQRVHALERKRDRMRAIAEALPPSMNLLADAVLFGVGAFAVLAGDIGAGALLASVVLFDALFQSIAGIPGSMRRLRRIQADLSHVDDAMRFPVDERFAETGKSTLGGKLSGAMQAENVTFSYTPFSSSVVHDVSLALDPGKSVVLTGVSGSGKSTLAKLLAGLYYPRSGSISYDGMALSAVPSETFRASVAMVGQETALFAGTVRENLTLWNPAVLESDVMAAAKDACIHGDIMRMTGGYGHVIAPGGANLSGGQRQRMEIARALAANPTILILDEATSALDAPTEREVLENIRRRGCTCIIVAHRLSAVRECDEMLVMDGGAVVERGTHEQLVRAGGLYAALASSAGGPTCR